MKQAILITAYKDVDNIIDIINYFDNNFEFYIHVDKKNKDYFTSIKNNKRVHVFSKYSVSWGGINHLKAILLLCYEGLKNNENTFFHLISGQDYPIKSVKNFQNIDETKDYIDINEFSPKLWGGGGFDRLDYYHFYDIINIKNTIGSGTIYKLFVFNHFIQKKLKLKRGYPNDFPKLYGGSTWWSLKRNTLQYVINYTNENDKFLNRMKFAFCSEEIYFQTVLMTSSDFKNSWINDNLRYIDWIGRNGNNPSVLDVSDFSKIISSNKLFARKFDKDISKELKQMLKDKLLSDDLK
ncbi:MAG: beta-1,6-N-acetylglucosaminyltransferase [Flavobacteriaceae bacterium]|jgi:hypothetical protein|nr:beta-1,6-N-acetylglucosaminyltransferase [Flavobacteriaceae bacterium]